MSWQAARMGKEVTGSCGMLQDWDCVPVLFDWHVHRQKVRYEVSLSGLGILSGIRTGVG